MKLILGLVVAALCWSVSAAEDLSHSTNLMVVGGQLSKIADRLEQSARDTIKQANLNRKSIISLRKQINEINQTDIENSDLLLQLKNKLLSAKALQQAAPLIRKQSERVRQQALHKLHMGMQLRYAEWITNPGPIVMALGEVQIQGASNAHNTRIMSTSPSMQGMRPKASLARSEDMSLELSSSMSQDLPAEIDTSSFVISRERHYFAHIEVEVEGANSGVLINQIQSWRLILTNTNGQPVRNANVKFNGHMPGHVHGLPTQPLITEEVAPGVYRISGVKFQMAGWWVIVLELEIPTDGPQAHQADALRFNLSL